ncbi:MAG: hypothetical protein V7K47_07110 [Nostoc sp.]
MEIIADNQYFLTIILSSENFVKVVEGKLILLSPEVVSSATWGRRCRLIDKVTNREIYYYLHSVLHASKGDFGFWVRNIPMPVRQYKSIVEAGYYN